jgi:hypothetical protein
MAHVRIHEVVGTVRVVDGDSLLSGPVLERIVEAVLEAVRADRRDNESRRRDTRIGDARHGESDGDRR